ncbi:tetratricopeptide repeat protein [Sphingomicrobium sp. XHP0239]|uniref:tetratricopeptide repeat protein n=1 Tax=Sphingomicrobium maritimum TaxID=3133972 RepID=UPI0031CC710A
MHRSLALTLVLAAGTAACTTPTTQIRMIQQPLQAGNLAASDRIAEGNAMMRLGNVGLAIEAYRRARRAEPDNPDVYVLLAAAYDRMGRTDLAATNYEQALALAPHRPDLYVALAHTLSRANRPEEARALLLEAENRRVASGLESAPVDDGALTQLARQVDEQERRLAQAAITRRVKPVRSPDVGPRLVPSGRATTKLVTRETPIWPKRDEKAPALVIAATKPNDDPVPHSPIEKISALSPEASGISESALPTLASTSDPVTVGTGHASAIPDAQKSLEVAPEMARLIETVTLDDDVIAMLLEDNLIDHDDVATLRLAQAARGAIVPPLRGLVWCDR